MGALVGLGVGVGLLLIYSAFALPRRPRPPRARRSRLAELLARAGLGHVSVNGFLILCVVLATTTTVVVQAVSRTPTVAVAFGVMGGYLPVALVAGRARRRRRELAEVWPEAVDNLTTDVRAGLTLSEALTQLGERGPEPLRAPFRRFAADYLATGLRRSGDGSTGKAGDARSSSSAPSRSYGESAGSPRRRPWACSPACETRASRWRC